VLQHHASRLNNLHAESGERRMRRGDALGVEPVATDEQLVQVATWFYVHGWSQIRIARELRLDPSTVSRYLKRARADGIVQVEIQRPSRELTGLGRAIAERHGLLRALVVEEEPDSFQRVSGAAAEHLESHLTMGMTLGLSWGRTVAGIVRRLQPGTVSGLTVVQLAGGVDPTAPDIQGHDIVSAVSTMYPHSQPRFLHAPAVVESERLARALLRDRSVRSTLDAGAASDLAVVGVGNLDPAATLVRGGHVTPQDHQQLLAAGAVGSMNTRYYDASGNPAGLLDNRTIALGWEQLRKIPMVVAVAAGADKAAAVAGALRTGAIDVLVVDDTIGRLLVGEVGPQQERVAMA
jgi:DNA-binding transcriptional regulator LsrR (DeoR family)